MMHEGNYGKRKAFMRRTLLGGPHGNLDENAMQATERRSGHMEKNGQSSGDKHIRLRRLVRASVIVFILGFVLPAASIAFGDDSPSCFRDGGMVEDSSVSVGINMPPSIEDSPEDLLDWAESVANPAGSPSSLFLQEAGFPYGSYEIRASADGAVSSCMLDEEEVEAFDSVRANLEAKEWVSIPIQGVTGATFVKKSGSLRWMLVTCSQVGESTCVVFRLNIAMN